jgi:hypothetical protein
MDVLADQQGEGRKHRQDVRGQLGAADAEKAEDHHRPQQQQPIALESSGRAPPAQGQRAGQQRGPGDQAREQMGGEVPPGAGAAMAGLQESIDMFVDEEEMGEFRVAHRDHHEPRHRNDREDQRAGQPSHAPPDAEVARQHAIGGQHRRGQHDPDQTLAHHRERHPRPGEPHAQPIVGRAGLVALAIPETQHGQAQAGRQPHVEVHEMAVAQPPDTTAQHAGRVQRDAWPQHGASGPPQGQHGKGAGQAWPESRREIADAEYRERRRGSPVLQRRFFEVEDAVQARRDPVAAGQHLAGDLGVAAFVGMDQVAIAQRAEPRDHCQQQQRSWCNAPHGCAPAAGPCRASRPLRPGISPIITSCSGSRSGARVSNSLRVLTSSNP